MAVVALPFPSLGQFWFMGYTFSKSAISMHVVKILGPFMHYLVLH